MARYAAGLLLALSLCTQTPGARAETAPPRAPLQLAMDNKPGGADCVIDTDCADNRCRYYPDGKHYCVSAGMSCAAPGGDGIVAGKSATVGGKCFRCEQGLGWKSCDSVTQGTNGRVLPNSR